MTTKLRSACDNCHQTKVRCSGHLPCQGCSNSRSLCFYSISNQLGRPRGTKNKRNSASSRKNTFYANAASDESRATTTTATRRALAKAPPLHRAQCGLSHNNNTNDCRNGSEISNTGVPVSYSADSLDTLDSWNRVPRESLNYKHIDNNRSCFGISDVAIAEDRGDDSFISTASRTPASMGDLHDHPNNNELIDFDVSDAAMSEYRDNSFITLDTRSPTTPDNSHYNLYSKDSSNLLQKDPETLNFQNFTSNGYAKPPDFNFEDIFHNFDTQIIPPNPVLKDTKSAADIPTSTSSAGGASLKLSSKTCSCLQQLAELLSNPKLSEALAGHGHNDGPLSIDKVLSLSEQGMRTWRSLLDCTYCPYNDDQEVMILTFMSIRAIVRYLQRLLPRYITTPPLPFSSPDSDIVQPLKEESSLVVGCFEITGEDRILVFRFLFQNTVQKIKYMLDSLQEIQDKKKRRLLDKTAKRTVGIDDYEASSDLFHVQQISHRLAASIESLELSLTSMTQVGSSPNEAGKRRNE